MFSIAILSIVLGAITAQEVFRLNNGRDCPVIGLGTGGFDGAPQGDKVKGMVRDAIDAGYRLIDTAAYYGNEKAIGQVVNELIAEKRVKRSELFISTKIFFLMGQSDPISRHTTSENILMGLQNLNQSYLDMILFHYPSPDPQVNQEVWRGFEDALNVGWVRSIGVSNFNKEQIDSLLANVSVIPAMNQVESHPQLPQKDLLEHCSQYKIRLTAWSPLGGGSLTSDPTIKTIGAKYGKTAAQVMLRWQYQRGVVVVPKSSKTERIKENIDIFDFTLAEEDMDFLTNKL